MDRLCLLELRAHFGWHGMDGSTVGSGSVTVLSWCHPWQMAPGHSCPPGLWLCLSRCLYHIPHFLPVGDEGFPSPPRSLGWFREPPGTMTPTLPSPWAAMAAGTLPVLSSELTESQNIPGWEGSIDPTHPW